MLCVVWFSGFKDEVSIALLTAYYYSFCILLHSSNRFNFVFEDKLLNVAAALFLTFPQFILTRLNACLLKQDYTFMASAPSNSLVK